MREVVRDVEIDGRRLRVAHRPGLGRPLIVCNGIGANLDLLDPFVAELDKGVAVIRFDVPGVGNSPLPRYPYNSATLARLVGRCARRATAGRRSQTPSM